MAKLKYQKLSVKLPESLYQKFKNYAHHKEVNMTELIKNYIRRLPNPPSEVIKLEAENTNDPKHSS